MSSFKDDFREETGVSWRPWRWFFYAIAVGLVVWLVFVIIGWVTQPVRTAGQVREKVGNADNVLYQYEHYFDLCSGVRVKDKQIAEKKAAIAAYDKRYPNGDPGDQFQAAPKRDRLDTELSGLKDTRTELAEKYNADTAKANRNLFKDRALPERITDDTPTCN